MNEETYKLLYTGFTKTWEQGAAAVNSSGDCMHFDPETGRKCAIGHLLDDPEQAEEDCLTVHQIMETVEGCQTWSPATMQALQRCHDDAATYSNFLVTFKVQIQKRLPEFWVRFCGENPAHPAATGEVC